MVELGTKIFGKFCALLLKIMHPVLLNYAHHRTISSIFIAYFGESRVKISTYNLIHTRESNCSAKINKNQHARTTKF